MGYKKRNCDNCGKEYKADNRNLKTRIAYSTGASVGGVLGFITAKYLLSV